MSPGRLPAPSTGQQGREDERRRAAALGGGEEGQVRAHAPKGAEGLQHGQLQLHRRHPDARLTGLDPDPHALARARAKAAREGAAVEWQQGFGDALPFADGAFDRVVSSLVFHHLTHDGRRATLAEIARVLAPGGRLLVLDFGPPHGALDRLLLHLFHRDDRLDDNLAGRIPALMADAGLVEPREVARMRSAFGSLAIWEASKR
jgi:SAM-dependent methyltransferase